MKKTFTFLTVLILFAFVTQIEAQSSLQAVLEKNFKSYNIQSIDSKSLYKNVQDRSAFHNVTLKLGSETFELELWDSGLRAEDYIIVSASDSDTNHSPPIPLKGYVNGDQSSNVRLTINDGFIMGYIKYEGKRLNIQPAWYFDDKLDKNQVVSYYDSAILESDEEASCSLHKHEDFIEQSIIDKPKDGETRVAGLCYEVEIALAADWLMFDEYGSISSTENQMTGVLNDVQGNYDDEFADEISYIHVESYISDCNTCDPWTSSTAAGTLLNSFTNWGPNGFSSVHDVATLWTDRNFDGGTVGVAWLSVICTNSRYNTCQDYTSTTWALRVLQAHELGHNWSCSHDAGGGFIMSPSVNNTTTWSGNSVNQLENHLASRNCLDNCVTSNPPVAAFDYEVIEDCVVGEVEFTDMSSGTTNWFWTFPGGNPSTSTDQNPVVNYNSAGVFNVTLEASNAAGADVLTEFDIITIQDVPFAEFDIFSQQLTVSFFDSGIPGNGAIYFWDFGDGSTSTDMNPIHDFPEPGVYTVTMEVLNNCGIDVYADVIEVYDTPVAGFTASSLGVCAPDTVEFMDLSYGNIESWDWTFEGGDPATSTLENPVVTFADPGSYTVSLEVTNPEGLNTVTEIDFVVLSDVPGVGFSSVVDEADVTFTNMSTNAIAFQWIFGDGNTSSAENPMHTYAASGSYQVVLQSTNPCGTVADTQTVVINLEPVASFTTAGGTADCADLTVDYLDTSLGNPTSWNWTFPGGNPATSTDQNPSVTYSNRGNFDVSLEVTNATGSDMTTSIDLVAIEDVPELSASFINNVLVVDFNSTYNFANGVNWDFGDGNTSTADDPTHTYATEGNYVVTVTATNACGTVTETLNVSVSAIPTAGITSNLNSGCSPLTVNYMDASSSNTTSWNWSFPGGNPSTSTLQNPTVVYATSGFYNVSLEVSNSSGSSSQTWTNFVEVISAPTADYDVQVIGNAISLENLTPGTTAEWSTSDGGSYSTTTASHTFEENGSYQVTLIVSNDCGEDRLDFEVVIDAYPTSDFGFGQSSGCAPFTVAFEDNSTNATTYLWEFTGGTPATSTEENPSVVYNTAGTYDVMLTVTNQYGTESLLNMDAIVIAGLPSASFASNPMGSTVDFTNNSTDGVSYSWDFGDGNTSDLENPTHGYVNPGTYEVELTVTNDCGSVTTTETVVVDFSTPGISASFSVSEGCAPLLVEITDNSSNDPTSWLWEFPGGTPASSTEQNPTVTYNSAGTYSIMATIGNADGTSMLEFVDAVIVEDLPTPDFDIVEDSGIITITNNSINADSFSWDFGDGGTSLDDAPTYEYASSGQFEVTLFATNDCGTVELVKTVIVEISSINNITNLGEWNISPNPSTGMINVIFENKLEEDTEYTVTDILGRNYRKGLIKSGLSNLALELEDSGTFFLVLTRGDERDVKKLIIIR